MQARAWDNETRADAISQATSAALGVLSRADAYTSEQIAAARTDLTDAITQSLVDAKAYTDLLAASAPDGPVASPEEVDAAVGRAIATGSVPTVETVDAIRPASGARAIGQGELWVSAKDYGAVGDGVTDDTAALQAAADAAVTIAGGDGELFIPAGIYRMSGTVQIRCTLHATGATFRYYGSGTALIIGRATPYTVTSRRTFELPRVQCMDRPTDGWDGTSVGVRAINLNTCVLRVPFVRDFEQGLVLSGENGGFAYTTVELGTLWENHKQLIFTCTPGGYVNQNTVIGGRLQLSYTRNQVREDPDAVQVQMTTGNPEGGPNNNTMVGTSLETDGVPEYILDIAGSYNQFLNCRWEASGATPRVRYRASALRNLISGGYNSTNLEETFDGTLGGGILMDTEGGYSRATLASSLTVSDSVRTAFSAWGAQVGRRVAQDVASGRFTPRPGRWRIDARVTFKPNSSGRRMAYLMTQKAGVGAVTKTVCEAPGMGGYARSTLHVSGTMGFDGQTTVWVEVQQTSDGALDLETSPGYNSIELEYLGN